VTVFDGEMSLNPPPPLVLQASSPSSVPSLVRPLEILKSPSPAFVGLSELYEWGPSMDLSIIVACVCLAVSGCSLLCHRQAVTLRPAFEFERVVKWELVYGWVCVAGYLVALVVTTEWEMLIRDTMLLQATTACLALFATVSTEIMARSKAPSMWMDKCMWWPCVLCMVFGQLTLFTAVTLDVVWPKAVFDGLSGAWLFGMWILAIISDWRAADSLRNSDIPVPVDQRGIVTRLHASFLMGLILLPIAAYAAFSSCASLSAARDLGYFHQDRKPDVFGAVLHGLSLVLGAWVLSFGLFSGCCRRCMGRMRKR